MAQRVKQLNLENLTIDHQCIWGKILIKRIKCRNKGNLIFNGVGKLQSENSRTHTTLAECISIRKEEDNVGVMAWIVGVKNCDTWTWGDLNKALYFCRRVQVLKKCAQRRKDPPYLSLVQVMYLSPSHWSGQGAHSSWLANLKQIVTGRRGKEERVCRRVSQPKPEQNGVTKTSFDGKGVILLCTTTRSFMVLFHSYG